MCTVSIVVHPTGVRLVCNRDEKRTRARALKPRPQDVGGGRRALFPIDPDGGGTWVGVNSGGLVAAVLNRTGQVESSSARRSCRLKSRGAIVPDILTAATIDEAIDRVSTLSSVPFAPFRLLILRHRALWTVTGGGEDSLPIERTPLLSSLVAASSSLGDRLVEAPRRALFGELAEKYAGSTLEAQSAFHAHRWPARPEISVVMSRRDARTVSRTQIDVVACRPGSQILRSFVATPHIEMRYVEIPEPDTPPRSIWSAGGLTPGSDPEVIHKDGDGAPC